jgi:Gluconate 2-dehydrogenase subunit 3
MNLQRREFFAILGIGAAGAGNILAQHSHEITGATPDFATYRPQALTQTQFELLEGLLETLLPADETGPGAREAHVGYYIDVVLKYGRDNSLQLWKDGLTRVEALTNQHFQKSFAKCSAPQRKQLMTELAQNEMAPATALDFFFVEFKRPAIDGFYASELIQREHLGYRGNTAVVEFPGCTHPDFQHPDLV